MIYYTTNPPKKLKTALFHGAVSFGIHYLDIDIDLNIEFQRLPQYQFGFCDYDSDEVVLVISRRLSNKDIISALFHELVHIKQYCDGRLENGSPQKWNGVEHDGDYENLPWELEAFELEEQMMKSFVDIQSESV